MLILIPQLLHSRISGGVVDGDGDGWLLLQHSLVIDDGWLLLQHSLVNVTVCLHFFQDGGDVGSMCLTDKVRNNVCR